MMGVGGVLGYYLLLISVRGYNFNIISTAQGMLKRTDKKLMSVVWHLARWLEQWILKDEKKIEPFLIDEK